MAAFPVTMFPFLVILHLTHGPGPVATVIKHYPAGLGSLLSYTLCVSLTYATLGLLWGTLLRSEEHTSELQSRPHLVCRLLLEKKKSDEPSAPLTHHLLTCTRLQPLNQ